MILCESDAPEGHPGQCCVHLYARILWTSFTSVSIFFVCCYSSVSISVRCTHSISSLPIYVLCVSDTHIFLRSCFNLTLLLAGGAVQRRSGEPDSAQWHTQASREEVPQVDQLIFPSYSFCWRYTDKKEKQILLIYKEIQRGAVAKSSMRKGFLIYEEMRQYTVYIPIHE